MTEWIDQEKIFMHRVRKEILTNYKKFSLYDDMMNYLVRNKFAKNKKELVNIFNDHEKLKLFLVKLSFEFLNVIAQREKMKVWNVHISQTITEKQILKYIESKKLKLSYSIILKNKKFNHNADSIHAMHSVGKIITGMLIMIFVRLKIIPLDALNKPIKIHDKFYKRLNEKVQTRLKYTTMLDIMTHKSGLGDYLTNYIHAVEKCVKNNSKMLNPIEPEDFLVYSDNKLSKKGEENYSNFGILLCGLSLKYYYNLNKKDNDKLTFNQILDKYIIKPNKLQSFMVSYKQIKNITTNRDNKNNTKYLNGSPAGGYWISANELTKLGYWIYKLCKNDKKLVALLKKYGDEFFDKKTNIISHYGSIGYSTASLEIDLDNCNIVTIMSNNYNDTDILSYALHSYK